MYKKIFGVLLALSVLLTSASAASFSDMPKADYWSYEALEAAVNDGLLNGSEGKIYPKNNLTRAEMATILVRAYKLTEKADISEYNDMSSDAWYYEYMQKACAKGLFKGDDTKKLNPGNNITRQEVFVVLSRALNLTGGKESVLDTFSDKENIASWAKDATASMIESGYIKGSGNSINPTDNITREEFAQIMYNLKKAGLFEEKKEEPSTGGSSTGGSSTGGSSAGGSSTGGSSTGGSSTGGSSTGGSSTGGSSTGGSSTGGSSTGGSSTGGSDSDKDDRPVVIPESGIDENVDMTDD